MSVSNPFQTHTLNFLYRINGERIEFNWGNPPIIEPGTLTSSRVRSASPSNLDAPVRERDALPATTPAPPAASNLDQKNAEPIHETLDDLKEPQEDLHILTDPETKVTVTVMKMPPSVRAFIESQELRSPTPFNELEQKKETLLQKLGDLEAADDSGFDKQFAAHFRLLLQHFGDEGGMNNIVDYCLEDSVGTHELAAFLGWLKQNLIMPREFYIPLCLVRSF